MKLTELKTLFHSQLDAIYGKDEVQSFFFLCTEQFVKLQRFQLVLQPQFTITTSKIDLFLKILEGLKHQKPIQYLLGKTEFYGLPFVVNKNVLIPRPETEELVDLIIKYHAERSVESQHPTPNTQHPITILDIGTGSGCIAISLAKHMPNAKVYALDVSEEALKVAKENAELNAIEIEFIKASILDDSTWDLSFKNLEFDVIVSNPPYVRNLEKAEIQSNVLDHEPHLALFVEDHNPLLFYKAITDFAITSLKKNGYLYFEINQYLGNETKALLETANFEAVTLLKDLNRNNRIVKGIKK
ncbi:MAG: peptide chain release factor N(5)-glutamine methyltransferase [Winogradskyella sp.]